MGKPTFYRNVYLYLSVGLVIVVWGFSKSYFSRLGEWSWPYHLHGISASLWMLLLVAQPLFYRVGKLKTHRILGWSSVVLVPLIVLAGVLMMRLMIRGQENYPPDTVYMLAFIDALTLLGFAALYFLAVFYRKRLMLHSRFMVATIFGPLVPALTRVFFVLGLARGFGPALTYTYILIEVVLIVILLKERNVREARITYLPVLVFIAIQHILMYFVNHWDWWRSLMDAFANYSS